MRVLNVCLAFLLLVRGALPASAQSTAQVRGVVQDTTGTPLPSATIALGGTATRNATTDQEGRFVFEGLPEGTYEVTVTFDGFKPDVRTFTLERGETEHLAITLWIAVLEQTFVTAARTGDRDVQTTPMAVSVLPGEELQRLEAHTVEDIAGRAPSVTFSQNTGFAQLTIRGIGTNAVFIGSDPSSAVYLDGVYLARPSMVFTDFLDIERVEVLRGPQGTLYGRNVVGGAINLIARAPANELEASARVVAGDGSSLRTEARVGGPLVRNRILASAAVLRSVRDGFVNDVNHPDHPLGGDDITAARGRVVFLFNERTDLAVSADVAHQDPAPLVYAKVLAVKPGFTIDNPPDLHDVRTSILAESRNVQYGTSARLTARLDHGLTLTSLTAYRNLDYELLVDADITELSVTTSNVHEQQHQISEELTIAQTRSRLTWIGGLFLFSETDRQPVIVGMPSVRRESRLDPRLEADSRAVFGEATFAVTPRLSATAGLRLTREEKTFDNQGAAYSYDVPNTPIPGQIFAYTEESGTTAWTPKFAVEARLSEPLFAYASATRGFKSGGFNLSARSAGLGYEPEYTWSYEVGLKSSLAGGKARVNVAVFHVNQTDLQVQTAIQPGIIDISNAAEATIRGVEVESHAQVIPGVRVGGHVAWLDATYDSYIAVGVGGMTGDVAGRRLSNAPEWSGRAWVEVNVPLAPSRLLSLRADSSWQSTVFFTPFNDSIQRQSAYGLLDMSAELRSSSWWSLGVYTRNLTDTDYITGTFSSPPPAIGGRPGKPRQAGVQFIVRR